MKQHITKEQWDELSEKNKESFWKCLGVFRVTDVYDSKKKDFTLPTIGQMIQFLGDDLDTIEKHSNWEDPEGWEVNIVFENEGSGHSYSQTRLELTDALWEAVKYKLKQ